MAEPENRFPTIRDLHERMGDLVEEGFGDLPVQIVIVPDSTLQAIALSDGLPTNKPVLMIDLKPGGDRLPVGLTSSEGLQRSNTASRERH